MSTIQALGIQGIRSFGPDNEDYQRVKFFKPLTLIQGPNGTGKTTVIECMKYATTGEMPPLCKGTASFINDPKIQGERETKAKVNCMINDVTGNSLTVERRVSAIVKDAKGKKVQMSTLDGVISRQNPQTGEKTSITSRCADLNREMISALGVSKAVLENVIFCHQEESSWPLTEGKQLKEKFDAIFASTRYSKVLDSIVKLRKEQEVDIKEGKRDLEYLKQHKEKAKQLQDDLEHLEMQLAASKDSVTKVQEKLNPVQERLKDIDERGREIQDFQRKKDKYTSEKEQIEKTIAELSSKIEEEFTGSTDDLKIQAKQFSSQVQAKNQELQECNRDQNRVTAELARLEKDINKLSVESGKLQQEAESNDKKIKERDAKILDLIQQYSFEGFEGLKEISETHYEDFFKRIRGRLETMMDTAKAAKLDYEEKEGQLQQKIDSLKESKTKLESGEKIKRDNIEKNKREMKEIKQKLANMISSEGRLAGLRTDLKRAERELEETESAVNIDELKKDIGELDRKKKQLDGEISQYNTEMNALHKQSGVQAQLEMFTTDLQEKESSISRLRACHEDSVVSLLGHMPEGDLRDCLEDYIQKQSDDVRRANASVQELRTKLSTKEAEKKNSRQQLGQKEEELRVKKQKIDDVCDGDDPDELLEEVERCLAEAKDTIGYTRGSQAVYIKYIKKLEKTNPDCPLCHRGFSTSQEARELIMKLKKDMRDVPAVIENAEKSMKKYQKRYDALIQLKPVKEAVSSLAERDIPELKTKLKTIEDSVKKLKEDQQTKEDDMDLLNADLETAKSILPDVVSMDRYKAEARELERKMEIQRSLLPRGGTTRSMDEVIELKEEQQLNLDNVNRNLDHKREKLGDHQDRLQRLRSRVHEVKGEKLTIEGELQQKSKLEERKVTLTSDNANFEREIEEARSELKPIENNIKKVDSEKKNVAAEKEVSSDKAKQEVQELKNSGQNVKAINQDIKAYRNSGKAEQLVTHRKRQLEMTAVQKTKKEEKSELEERVNTLREDVARADIQNRALEDTITLRRKQEEVVLVQGKIDEVQVKLGNMDIKNLRQEQQQLMAQEDQMRKELHNAEGRQQGFNEQIKSTKKDLNSDMCKDADKKYRDKKIEVRTLEIANADLAKYYKAMDLAIMRYHNEKMAEINVIIRNLWTTTYTGTDIEGIEIRSEDDGSATASVIKTKRTFNYRVVMIKNGVPIDMRGRCSAGQKVLSCLLIRLALAETFCVNCGILALDEPTTNLDRSNIESLSNALVTLIKDRSQQRHFQLVIITHDEDFVELLGRSEYVDRYIQVGKNQDGFSRLSVKNVEELHSRPS